MTIGPFSSLWVFDQPNFAQWMTEAQSVIETLQNLTGFIEAQVGRSPEEPHRLIVTTKWVDVGSYRRALSSTAAKMNVWPFLANMHDQPSAFEVLLSANSAEVQTFESSLEN